MIALDTDVLVVYYIFHNDPRYDATKRLFEKLGGQTKALTIFNLLEFCGILATANRKDDSHMVFHTFITAEDTAILFPKLDRDEKELWPPFVLECFSRIQKGLRLGDAVILWTLETNENIESFITWNTKHFLGKTSIKVLSPPEFL